MLLIPVVLLVLALLAARSDLGIGTRASCSTCDHRGVLRRPVSALAADRLLHVLLGPGHAGGRGGRGAFLAGDEGGRRGRRRLHADGGNRAQHHPRRSRRSSVTTSSASARATRRGGLAHLGAFYGFAALFVVSAWAVIALYMINPVHSGPRERPALSVRLAGHPVEDQLAELLRRAIALIAGCVMAIRDRLKNEEGVGGEHLVRLDLRLAAAGRGRHGVADRGPPLDRRAGLHGAEHRNGRRWNTRLTRSTSCTLWSCSICWFICRIRSSPTSSTGRWLWFTPSTPGGTKGGGRDA